MLIIAAAIIAIAPGMPMTDQKSIRSPAPVCQQVAAQKVAKAGQPLTHDLGKEPSADAFSAVLYTEGQCTKPIVVSRDIGMKRKGR